VGLTFFEAYKHLPVPPHTELRKNGESIAQRIRKRTLRANKDISPRRGVKRIRFLNARGG